MEHILVLTQLLSERVQINPNTGEFERNASVEERNNDIRTAVDMEAERRKSPGERFEEIGGKPPPY